MLEVNNTPWRGQVATERGQDPLINVVEEVNGAVTDVQRG